MRLGVVHATAAAAAILVGKEDPHQGTIIIFDNYFQQVIWCLSSMPAAPRAPALPTTLI